MIYIVTSYEYEDNEFSLKDIYVSDDNTMYVLSKSQRFIPMLEEGSVLDLVDATNNLVYPMIGFGDVREYNDDDPKSFASFLHRKIEDVDFSTNDADKALYNVMNSFGESHVQVSV